MTNECFIYAMRHLMGQESLKPGHYATVTVQYFSMGGEPIKLYPYYNRYDNYRDAKAAALKLSVSSVHSDKVIIVDCNGDEIPYD